MRRKSYKKKEITAESSFLTPLDRQIYMCQKSQSAKIIKSNIMKNSLKETLGLQFEEIDEQGNVTEVSIAQKIINATIQDAIENPDTRKLKDLANIAGELKEAETNVNVNFTSPTELFKGIGFEEEVVEAKYEEVSNT